MKNVSRTSSSCMPWSTARKVNLFCSFMKSMTTAQCTGIEKALDRFRQRYGVSSGLTSEPKVITTRHGAKVNFTASSLNSKFFSLAILLL